MFGELLGERLLVGEIRKGDSGPVGEEERGEPWPLGELRGEP